MKTLLSISIRMIGVLLFMTPGLFAAEPGKPIKIGALTDSWGPTPGFVGLRDGLVELGYKENKDFFIGVRFTQGNVARLPQAARELVEEKVDLIFTNNAAPAKAAQMATSRIPIVFYDAGDPIALGLIKSFSHPGGNVTGITDLELERDTKRLEIFKEMLPELKRVLFIYDPSEKLSVAQSQVYRDTAEILGLNLTARRVGSRDEAMAVFRGLENSRTGGIIAPRSLSFNIPGLAIRATSEKKIPTMFSGPWFVEQGGLASYGTDFYESGRMAARLVDEIIKGKKPSEIPVEVNPKIEFVVNLKVANELGLKIAPGVLYRANRVIR